MNLSLVNAIKNYKVKIINIINDSNSELNKIVKRIFVINIKEDIYKRNYIIVLMQKYKINFTLVIVERISDNLYNEICSNSLISQSELGCCISHLWCLYQIIKNNFENAIIFEDDIIFHKDFIRNFLNIYDIKFDFLLLGAHDYCFSKFNYKNIKNNLYFPNEKSNYLYGAYANYYSLEGARRMFSIRISEVSFFDKEYMLMFNYFKDTSFICYPNLVVTNMTVSSLNHEREFLTNLEFEYYKKCFIKFNFSEYNFIYLNILLDPTKKEYESYESYIYDCLQKYFNDLNKVMFVKKRFAVNFFTLDDIINILDINNSK